MQTFNRCRKCFDGVIRRAKTIGDLEAVWGRLVRLCATMEKNGISTLRLDQEKGAVEVALARVLGDYATQKCYRLRETALILAGIDDPQ